MDNPDAAERFVAQMKQQCKMLADFPEMGRLSNELNPPLSSFSAGNYLIFYRPGTESGIEVIGVVSSYRDVEAFFVERQGN